MKAVLSERKMVADDLKYLPACEVKDILGGNFASSKQSPNKSANKGDSFSEVGISD